MIEGVKIKEIKVLSDNRGFFAELLKAGEETFIEVKQTSCTSAYPGVIKAFHWHKKQTDVWFVAFGMVEAVLHDLRWESPTFRQTDVFYLGQDKRLLLLIPPAVAHGYRVLGQEPALLFYHTSGAYDSQNPDEQRIPFDDPGIGFDWQTKNR